MSTSLFATLRRRKDKAKGHGTVFVPDTKSEPIFNSTPNLHKINLNNSKPVSGAGRKKHVVGNAVFYPGEEEVDGVYYDHHHHEDVIIEEGGSANEDRYGGFSSRRASSATSEDGGHGSAGKYQKNKGQGSLRHFASMVSMFGSLKRTKSSRKVAYGSTQDFDTEKSDFMRQRAAVPACGRKSPDPVVMLRSALSSSSNYIDKKGGAGTQQEDSESNDMSTGDNQEPGVRTSSSSSSNNSLNSATDGLGSGFTRSRNDDDEDDEHQQRFDYTTTKTEEELKRTKLLIQGIKKFNMDPKKGIEFLVEHDIVQNTPEDVSKFLKYGEGLSKTAIGNYLGEHIDFNEEVLQSFLDLHDFKDLILVQALREFLWSFRLPGESQKIDRMMEAFAKRYCQSNPGIFSCTDTCYLLSYSIIMLNTTLHNPSVKDKPTVEQFIQMNRDVDCGKSLNKAFLVHSYNSILAEPFKIPPEDANDLVLTFFNPNIEGWLWKQGGYKTWKRRWFILSNNCLYYFKFTTDKSPRGIIPLENVHAKEVTSSSRSNELFPFILFKKSSNRSLMMGSSSDVIKTCKTLSNGTTILSQYHTITLASINQEERSKWVQSINQNNSNSDFYDVLTIKKRNLEIARRNQGSSKRSHSTDPSARSCGDRKGTPIKPNPNKTRKPAAAKKLNLEVNDFDEPDLKQLHRRSPRDQRRVPVPEQEHHESYYKTYPAVFSNSSSHASISSGMERDSSYGSFSDISRSRSESRILECSRNGSMSSVEHDTGSLGSRGGSIGLEDKFIEFKESRVLNELPKKLSVIEESQSHPSSADRSSSSSSSSSTGAMIDKNNPVSQGYRMLSEEELNNASHNKKCRGGASALSSLDDTNYCDNNSNPRRNHDTNQNKLIIGTNELSLISTKIISGNNNDTKVLGTSSTSTRYSRSGSIESDV